MTAFVWTGRNRPKVTNCKSRFAPGKKFCTAHSSPALMPTMPQITVAMANARTMRLSYLKVSIFPVQRDFVASFILFCC